MRERDRIIYFVGQCLVLAMNARALRRRKNKVVVS